MRIILQLLAIVWTIFSLAVSASVAGGDSFSSTQMLENWIHHIQSVLLHQGNPRHIYASLWCTEDIQWDEGQDNHDEDQKSCGNWKIKSSHVLSFKIITTIKKNIKYHQIRQSNIVWSHFTDLVWIIKITI